MKIFINTDTYKKRAVKTEEELTQYCRKLDIEIAEDIEESDIVFSIGGDGTFLKTARLSSKPIIGINTGTVGFLTEINPDDLKSALDDIINQNYHIENRMMLEGEIHKADGEIIKIPQSLNEIAVSKNMLGVVRFDVFVNGKFITSHTADGIIVCTPTGSTAYNFSCGGPVAEPTAEIITVTPIAPHSIINRSMILSENSVIEIKITEIRDNTHSFVLYDGIPVEVVSGDSVKIFKSQRKTEIIKMDDSSFIKTISKKISSQ